MGQFIFPGLVSVYDQAWTTYINELEANQFVDEKLGKWLVFFNDIERAKHICKNAVEEKVVAKSQYSNEPKGVACFYLNCDDLNGHKRVISYLIENHLIPKSKNGNFLDIDFYF